MIPELDIYRSANILVKHHGQDAPIEAAMRADAMLDKGDLDGYLRLWLSDERRSRRHRNLLGASTLTPHLWGTPRDADGEVAGTAGEHSPEGVTMAERGVPAAPGEPRSRSPPGNGIRRCPNCFATYCPAHKDRCQCGHAPVG